MTPARTPSPLVATMRYKDAPAAIEWLCDALGFERHLVVPDDGGGIAHAQLRFGNGMIMLGSDRDDAFGSVQRAPTSADAVVTQSVYLIVDDPDAHYQRALDAGAQVVMPIRDEDYGGRGFTIRDPGGHVWTVGSYDPWADG